MGFVRTPHEVARIQAAVKTLHFTGGEVLSAEFLTRPDIVREVLPPGLDPVDEPRAVASVSRWRSNVCGDFAAGALYLKARHGDLVGLYPVAMFMDRDSPMLFGRDTWGEPKKVGDSELRREGAFMAGWTTRHGTRLIAISGEMGPDQGASESERVTFNVKASLAPDGHALDGPALLIATVGRSSVSVFRAGVGDLELASTPHDPLGDMEIVELLGVSYSEVALRSAAKVVATIPAEVFLPYHLGRIDDWSQLDTTSRQ